MARFSAVLLDHATYPRNQGQLGSPCVMGTCSFNGQPPYVTFYVRLNDGVLVAVRFEAHGCGVTIAACSMLCELAEGQRLADAQTITADDVGRSLQGIPEDKQHSLQVAYQAFANALANIAGDQGNPVVG